MCSYGGYMKSDQCRPRLDGMVLPADAIVAWVEKVDANG
jgi:hypothetical protein